MSLSTDLNSIQETIASFLEEDFFIVLNSDYHEDDNILKLGLIDSFGMVQLLLFVEKEFGVEIPSTWLEAGRLNSLKMMAETIQDLSDAQN